MSAVPAAGLGRSFTLSSCLLAVVVLLSSRVPTGFFGLTPSLNTEIGGSLSIDLLNTRSVDHNSREGSMAQPAMKKQGKRQREADTGADSSQQDSLVVKQPKKQRRQKEAFAKQQPSSEGSLRKKAKGAGKVPAAHIKLAGSAELQDKVASKQATKAKAKASSLPSVQGEATSSPHLCCLKRKPLLALAQQLTCRGCLRQMQRSMRLGSSRQPPSHKHQQASRQPGSGVATRKASMSRRWRARQ